MMTSNRRFQATIHGLLLSPYMSRFAEGGAQMARWMAEGRLRIDEDVQVGLENAYPAFMRLFSGANRGKLLLKIADLDGKAATSAP